MIEVYDQQATDKKIKMEIEIEIEIGIYTRPGSLDPDTIAFLQVLDHLYGLCKHPLMSTPKFSSYKRALRGDLFRST